MAIYIFGCYSKHLILQEFVPRIHRRIMQEYQVIGKMAQTRAVRVMMFIVESGVGYCLLWVRRFLSAITYRLIVLTV